LPAGVISISTPRRRPVRPSSPPPARPRSAAASPLGRRLRPPRTGAAPRPRDEPQAPAAAREELLASSLEVLRGARERLLERLADLLSVSRMSARSSRSAVSRSVALALELLDVRDASSYSPWRAG
jgi:hypothetical protein